MPLPRALVLLVALLACALPAAGAAAQDATPAAGGFDPTARFPAHLHRGTCEAPGGVVFPLAEAGYGLPVPLPAEGTPTAATAAYVGGAANPAAVSVGTVPAALDDVVAAEHLVDVHRAGGGGEDAARIVCGGVGGFRAGDDLVFGLGEANGSGYTGTAWLHDNGDGTTTVALFLASGLAGADDAAAAGAPAPGAAPIPAAAHDAPAAARIAGLPITDGEFGLDQLALRQGVPTVLHVVNGDDRGYELRIGDLVTPTLIPANQVTLVEFTNPTPISYRAELRPAGEETVLDTMEVVVLEPGEVAP